MCIANKLRVCFTGSVSCPGPGNRGGNFPVLPASKEAESPSNLFYVDSMCVEGGGCSPSQTGGAGEGTTVDLTDVARDILAPELIGWQA